MLIGVPKEIKNHEYRVGLTPANAHELVENGHTVFVETNAGIGIGFSDADYIYQLEIKLRDREKKTRLAVGAIHESPVAIFPTSNGQFMNCPYGI